MTNQDDIASTICSFIVSRSHAEREIEYCQYGGSSSLLFFLRRSHSQLGDTLCVTSSRIQFLNFLIHHSHCDNARMHLNAMAFYLSASYNTLFIDVS